MSFRPVSDARYWFSQARAEAFKRLPIPVPAFRFAPQGALFLKNGGVVELDYSNPQESAKLEGLDNGDCDAIGWRDRIYGRWAVTVRWGEGMGITAHAITKEEAYEAACKIRERKQAEEARVQSEPLLFLERELHRHDWWHHMSDSYAAAESGRRHMEEILDACKKCPTEEARLLWGKIAPIEFPCPF
jgi:hypothetical protein